MKNMRQKLQDALVDMVTNTMMKKLFSPEIGGEKGGGKGGILAGLVSIVKHAQGGIVAGALRPIAEFANGGIISRPTLAMVGEGGGPEAVVPLKNGAIPVLGSTQNQPIIININAMDAASFQEYLAQHGSGVIAGIAGQVAPGAVESNIRSAGSLRNYFRKD